MRRVAAIAIAALSLSGCERAAEAPTGPAARPGPVVVYASFEDENYLPALFADFTRETGIPVTVRHRPEEQIVSELIEKRGSPPADVLLTRSVHGIWQAADEGALRPLQSDTVTAIVPGWLRDPDGYWTAAGFDTIDVVCNADRQRNCDAVTSYEDLGEPEFSERLCLSTSTLAVNRLLIAGLITDHGAHPAETLVRGLVANLALPPYETERALLQAVEAGTCPLAVVSSRAFHEFGRPTVAATWPWPGYFDVVAAGVGRHARSPDAARSLVEWLLGEHAQAAQFDATGLRPANPGVPAGSADFPAPAGKNNTTLFGLYYAEAVKLAERARWY
ncbi:MAG TPA: extracellular solute-binding protein [Woeseiaceae bacterium]|nr:extracellular solute-binding protein [Woeseiaceae bacterium]